MRRFMTCSESNRVSSRYNQSAAPPPPSLRDACWCLAPAVLPCGGGFSFCTLPAMARKPPPRPPSIMEMLRDVSDTLRDMEAHGLAGDVEAASECVRTMLELTKFGDCLFGDEIRNILNIRHALRPRRGTALDPMHGQRKDRRSRHKAR